MGVTVSVSAPVMMGVVVTVKLKVVRVNVKKRTRPTH